MKLDFSLTGIGTREAAAAALKAEQVGFEGVWTSESVSDGLMMSMGAVLATSSVDVASAIVVAFARNPMLTAYASWDLASASSGRFSLGIGTQTRAHVQRRFCMPWSQPVQRVVDFVGATRAIWSSWQTGEPLNYEGEFYRHSLMTPMFTPPHHDFPLRILGSAVGPRMTEAVGRHFDGLIGHPFVTTAYFDDVIAPALGDARDNPTRDFTIFAPLILLIGDDDEAIALERTRARQQLAFYGSTPEYRGVLESIGKGELQEKLHAMSRQNQWEKMGDLIDDDLLDATTISGTPESVVYQVHERWGQRLDRVSSISGWPTTLEPDRLRALTALSRELA